MSASCSTIDWISLKRNAHENVWVRCLNFQGSTYFSSNRTLIDSMKKPSRSTWPILRGGYSGSKGSGISKLKLRSGTESTVLRQYTCTHTLLSQFYCPIQPACMGRVIFCTEKPALSLNSCSQYMSLQLTLSCQFKF
jgi:hypothetical protein